MSAASEGHAAVVRLLLSHDPAPNPGAADQNGRTVLMRASENGHDAVLKLLLSHDPAPGLEAANQRGRTALILAAEKGHSAIVRLLLDHDPTPCLEAADQHGCTALMCAAYNGHDAVVQLLLQLSRDLAPDLEAADKCGKTVLILAAEKGCLAVVRLLLDHDPAPDLEAADQHGMAVLMRAAENGHDAVVQLLLSRDPAPDLEAADKCGKTVLSLAAEKGHLAVVRLLLDHDPAPCLEAADQDGRTASMLAKANGHDAIVQLLPVPSRDPARARAALAQLFADAGGTCTPLAALPFSKRVDVLRDATVALHKLPLEIGQRSPFKTADAALRRQSLWADTDAVLTSARQDPGPGAHHPLGLRRWPLQVKFEGEWGLDAGGPSKDFLSAASADMIAPWARADAVPTEAALAPPPPRLFTRTADGASFQPHPLAPWRCPDSSEREASCRSAGELCGAALWNVLPLSAPPAQFFARRVLQLARSSRLVIAKPRTGLCGDKCIFPAGFVAHASTNGSGSTYRLQRPAATPKRAIAASFATEDARVVTVTVRHRGFEHTVTVD